MTDPFDSFPDPARRRQRARDELHRRARLRAGRSAVLSPRPAPTPRPHHAAPPDASPLEVAARAVAALLILITAGAALAVGWHLCTWLLP